MSEVGATAGGTSRPATRGSGRLTPVAKRGIVAALLVVLLVAMALGTKVVGKGDTTGAGPHAFSAPAWGKANFPKVQAAMEKRAVPAATLSAAVAKSPTAAGKKYGVDAGTAPEISVSFTGTVGKGSSGIYPVKVAGLPKNLLIRVQTGPAINGTDLRDATGTITFGEFTNQIDYQNAASALNDAAEEAGPLEARHHGAGRQEGHRHRGVPADQPAGLARDALEDERPVNDVQDSAVQDEVVLSARDMVKTYGGTIALKGVNFDIHRGRVTTLFGENGAGKSTLMKILSGVEQPTSGEILLGGERVSFASTVEARNLAASRSSTRS